MHLNSCSFILIWLKSCASHLYDEGVGKRNDDNGRHFYDPYTGHDILNYHYGLFQQPNLQLDELKSDKYEINHISPQYKDLEQFHYPMNFAKNQGLSSSHSLGVNHDQFGNLYKQQFDQNLANHNLENLNMPELSSGLNKMPLYGHSGNSFQNHGSDKYAWPIGSQSYPLNNQQGNLAKMPQSPWNLNKLPLNFQPATQMSGAHQDGTVGYENVHQKPGNYLQEWSINYNVDPNQYQGNMVDGRKPIVNIQSTNGLTGINVDYNSMKKQQGGTSTITTRNESLNNQWWLNGYNNQNILGHESDPNLYWGGKGSFHGANLDQKANIPDFQNLNVGDYFREKSTASPFIGLLSPQSYQKPSSGTYGLTQPQTGNSPNYFNKFNGWEGQDMIAPSYEMINKIKAYTQSPSMKDTTKTSRGAPLSGSNIPTRRPQAVTNNYLTTIAPIKTTPKSSGLDAFKELGLTSYDIPNKSNPSWAGLNQATTKPSTLSPPTSSKSKAPGGANLISTIRPDFPDFEDDFAWENYWNSANRIPTKPPSYSSFGNQNSHHLPIDILFHGSSGSNYGNGNSMKGGNGGYDNIHDFENLVTPSLNIPTANDFPKSAGVTYLPHGDNKYSSNLEISHYLPHKIKETVNNLPNYLQQGSGGYQDGGILLAKPNHYYSPQQVTNGLNTDAYNGGSPNGYQAKGGRPNVGQPNIGQFNVGQSNGGLINSGQINSGQIHSGQMDGGQSYGTPPFSGLPHGGQPNADQLIGANTYIDQPYVGKHSGGHIPGDDHLDSGGHLDSGHHDSGHHDSGHLDSGHLDSGHLDSGHLDSGHFNGGYGGHLNGGHFNGGHINDDHLDGGHLDGGHIDVGHQDGGHLGVGHQDGGHLNGAPEPARGTPVYTIYSPQTVLPQEITYLPHANSHDQPVHDIYSPHTMFPQQITYLPHQNGNTNSIGSVVSHQDGGQKDGSLEGVQIFSPHTAFPQEITYLPHEMSNTSPYSNGATINHQEEMGNIQGGHDVYSPHTAFPQQITYLPHQNSNSVPFSNGATIPHDVNRPGISSPQSAFPDQITTIPHKNDDSNKATVPLGVVNFRPSTSLPTSVEQDPFKSPTWSSQITPASVTKPEASVPTSPDDFELLLPNTFDYGFMGQQEPNGADSLSSKSTTKSSLFWTQSSVVGLGNPNQLPSYEYGNPTPSYLDIWSYLKRDGAASEKLNHRPSKADVAPYDDNVNYPGHEQKLLLLSDSIESLISQSFFKKVADTLYKCVTKAILMAIMEP